MKIIAKGRGKGKTTELIKMSAEKQIPILCGEGSTRNIIDMAKKMNLEIPKPLTLKEINLYQYRDKPILIDNVEYVLNNKFGNVKAITMSSDCDNELETDNDDKVNYSDEIVKKLKENVKKISSQLDNCTDYNKYIAGLKAIEKSMEIIHNFDWQPQFSKYRVDNMDDSGSHYEVATWEQNSDNEIRNHKCYELKSPKNLNGNPIRKGVSCSNGEKHVMTDDEMDNFEEKFDKEMNSMKNVFKENMRVFEDMNRSFGRFFESPFRSLKMFNE